MINRQKNFYTIAAFITLFALSYSCNHAAKENTSQGHKLDIAAIQVGNGWGYNILVDNKVYIHQYCIPAVGGNKVFSSKEDALKTARVVVEKMMKGKIPSITRHDLDSLNIAL